MKHLVVLLTLALVLLVPSVALAEEIDYLDSFAGGFDTLVNGRESEAVRPESEFNDSYEPEEVVLYSEPTREYDEESTTVDYVNGTLDSFNRVSWGAHNYSFLEAIKLFLGGLPGATTNALFIVPAVGLVFMWWGVRKAKHMIMTAFRSGRLTFGYDLNPRSYYFGTRRSDWR